MKAIILLNGEPYRGAIDASSARVWCCDGAYDWAKGKVRIDENLGDYDSLSYMPDPPPAEVYPSEKNYTDGELALMRAERRRDEEKVTELEDDVFEEIRQYLDKYIAGSQDTVPENRVMIGTPSMPETSWMRTRR